MNRMRALLQRMLGYSGREASALDRIDFASGLGDGAWLLHGITRGAKPETVVEIGSAQGKSACYIGTALRENGHGHLYAIDPHSPTEWNDIGAIESYPIIQRNIRKTHVAEHVTLVRKTSEEAAREWTRPIDLLFIDGDHSYEGVKRDWELFLPHMTSFGVIVFHDTLWDISPDPRYARDDMGVPRFVEELRVAGYPVITIDQNYGVSIVQPRKGGVSLSDITASTARSQPNGRRDETAPAHGIR
jgi:predicted O-methyltransferase YrrM